METLYHGTGQLFNRFDLSHVLEGDGKIKFGFGVYVTTSYESAAHYAGARNSATHYVYTVKVPSLKPTNHIAFKQPVHPIIVRRAEERLGISLPEVVKSDGKNFRKYLTLRLAGKQNVEGEKAAADFLDSIGVDYIVWPYSWRDTSKGTNRAVVNADKVRIVRIDQVELDADERLVPGSQKVIYNCQPEYELL